MTIVGCVYLSTNEFMSYHSEALEADWSDLESNYQGLILGLIKGLGSGALIAGCAVLYMVYVSWRQSAQSHIVLLPLISVGYSALLCYATYFVYSRTPGNPPVLANSVLVVMSVSASCILVCRSQKP